MKRETMIGVSDRVSIERCRFHGLCAHLYEPDTGPIKKCRDCHPAVIADRLASRKMILR